MLRGRPMDRTSAGADAHGLPRFVLNGSYAEAVSNSGSRPSPAVGDPARISLAGSPWVTGLRRPTRTPPWLDPAISCHSRFAIERQEQAESGRCCSG